MYWVYILYSEFDSNFYVGFTDNLKRRIQEHNAGRVKSTKHRTPLKLIYQEEYETKESAVAREKYLKGKGGIRLKQHLRKRHDKLEGH